MRAEDGGGGGGGGGQRLGKINDIGALRPPRPAPPQAPRCIRVRLVDMGRVVL